MTPRGAAQRKDTRILAAALPLAATPAFGCALTCGVSRGKEAPYNVRDVLQRSHQNGRSRESRSAAKK